MVQTPKCSNSSGGGGGRSSKKVKQKKVPQRGMGVAQLEKIILEEQQKKDVGIFTPNSPATSSSSLANVQSVTSFRPPLPNQHPLIPKTDPNFVSKPLHMTNNSGGGNNWSRLWAGGEYGFQEENPNLKRGFMAAMPTNLRGLSYESNPPIWPQRSQLIQRPCSSSMVNVSLGTTSSSVLNFQMEPPSNQSYSLWPDEEKMIGMKRSYPFSMENMPTSSFNCKIPFSSISRSDESTSCSNGGATSLDPSNPVVRENPSSYVITDRISKKLVDEDRDLTKDFLTLAPPSKEQLPPLSMGELGLPPHQGQTLETEWSSQQPLLTFFPPAKSPENSNGEGGEHVDLNLKL